MKQFVLILPFLIFSNCAGFLLKTAIQAERGKGNLERKQMDIEKFSVPFLESSSSNKIPIVFLHGFGGDKDNWIRMIPHLKDQYRAISLDLPGFGESNRLPDENYSIAEQVKRVKKFTEKLGLKKFHIVGNSMGGSISAYYASQYPDEIISLILIDSAGVTSPIKSDLEIEIEKGYNPLLVKNMDDFDKLNNFIFVKKPYILGSIKEYFVEKALENTNINVKILNDIRNEKNPVEASLSKIKSHTLILWGDTDRIIHVSSTQVFQKNIKNSKLIVLKDCGHSPQIERPEEVASHILQFVSSIQP
jgi:abhydrolase domain-containing protein 6